MATHSSVLAWRIPRTEEPVGCRLWGRTESDITDATQQQHRYQKKEGLQIPEVALLQSWNKTTYQGLCSQRDNTQQFPTKNKQGENQNKYLKQLAKSQQNPEDTEIG